MKTTKKFWTIVVAMVLLCSTAIGVVVFAADTAAKPISYAYALLGDSYQVEDGLVSASAPDGAVISPDTKSVLLDWAQGSYRFEYETKIVDLKVYESAPEDTVIFSSENPDSVTAGVATNFSGVKVTSNIVRTDGAPEVGQYSVNAVFWLGGERVTTIKNASESFVYTPDESGIWVISYEYTDVFGRSRNIDNTFTVVDERIIIDDFQEEYFVGDKISTSDAYGFWLGSEYTPKISVTTPSGKTETFTNSYLFSEKGVHQIKLSADIDGENVEKTVEVTVKSGIASFLTNVRGFSAGTEFTNYSNVTGEGVESKGLLMDMTSSNASFSYNGVIDLSKLGKNTPVISFTTNNTYAGTISKVQVTLTDVYDSQNTVTVTFSRNSDMTATSTNYDNVMLRATFGSISTAFANYYPLKTDSVGWDSTFNTYWNSPAYENSDKTYSARENLYSMNFSYDFETNTIYSYGNFRWYFRPDGEQTGVKWWPVAYLSDSSLATQFGGFTTGEVYLSFKVSTGRGDVVIDSIGGKSFSVNSDAYDDDNSIILKGFEGSVPAVVGCSYNIPSGNSDYVSSFSRKMMLDEKEISVKGNTFTPTEAGTYKLVFSGVNQFGRTIEKIVEFECLSQNIPIEISYNTQSDAQLGGLYTIELPTVSGGHGKISYSIDVNGNSVSACDVVVVGKQLIVTVNAVDELGFTASESFEIEIDKDVLLFDVEFPRAAFKGDTFQFPSAEIYYGKKGENVPYEVYVDGEKQGSQMTLPTSRESVSVSYVTDYGSKTFVLTLRDKTLETGGDALIFNGKSETFDEGTEVTVSASSVVSLPFRLSPDELRFEFFVLEEDLNFNTLSLRLTGANGTSVKLSLSDLKQDTAKLLINDVQSASVTKRQQTFSSTASAEFAGKNYYSFSIVYDDWYKAVLNGSQIRAYVQKDERGVVFDGFGGGVYMDIFAEDTNGTAQFVITRIGNQLFSASSFELGDIVGPSLYSSDFRLGNSNVSSNYVLSVSSVAAFDVLQNSVTVKLTLTAPDGTVIYRDILPENAPATPLSKTGVYVLKVSATDGAGAVTTANYRFSVEDETAPELSVENVVTSAQKGETVTLAAATATDESSTTIKLVVVDPHGRIYFVASGASVEPAQFTFTTKGIYKVFYIASDEYGNTSQRCYQIVVGE